MRPGIEGRCLGAVQGGILSLRDHLSDLRRRNDFSAALRGGVHRARSRRVYRDDGFHFFAGGRSGVGVDEGSAHLEMKRNGGMERWSNGAMHNGAPLVQYSITPIPQSAWTKD